MHLLVLEGFFLSVHALKFHPEKFLGTIPFGAFWKGQFTFQSGIIFTSVTILIGKIYITYLSFANDSDGKEKISIPKALF